MQNFLVNRYRAIVLFAWFYLLSCCTYADGWYDFRYRIHPNPSDEAPLFSDNAELSGEFFYDPTDAAEVVDAPGWEDSVGNFSAYYEAVSEFKATIDEHEFSAQSVVTKIADGVDDQRDEFVVDGGSRIEDFMGTIDGFEVKGFQLSGFTFWAKDDSSLFASQDLPPFLEPSDGDNGMFMLFVNNDGQFKVVSATLISLEERGVTDDNAEPPETPDDNENDSTDEPEQNDQNTKKSKSGGGAIDLSGIGILILFLICRMRLTRIRNT